MSYQYWGFEPWISGIRVRGLIHSAMTAPRVCRTNIEIRTLDLWNKSPWSHPLSNAISSMSYQYWGFEPWISQIRVHGLIHSDMIAPQ